MLIDTFVADYKRVYGTDNTTATVAMPAPTIVEPTGDGIISMVTGSGILSQNMLDLMMVSKAADGAAVNMLIVGWRPLRGVAGSTVDLWLPKPLAQYAFTMSTLTGVATSLLGTAYRFPDTVALTFGNANVSDMYLSPVGTYGNTAAAWVRVDAAGHPKIGIYFGDASQAGTNCLYAGL